MEIEWTKLRRKVLYHFAIFAIVNKILIAKNCRKLIFNNFLLKYCQFYRKTFLRNSFFSHKILWIFSEFFINFLVLHFLIFINMRKYNIKKFWKNSKKILTALWEENKQFCLLQFFCKVDSIWVKNYWSQFLAINILFIAK